MGLGSILLGVFAFICMFAGILLTWFPFLGTMLSFLGPILAIAGIILGGVAMSRSRQNGENDGLAIAGLIVNIIAFVPAMLVALTCGLCNTLCTGAMLTPHDPNTTPFWMQDSGPSPWGFLFPDAGALAPDEPGQPPPAFPPPAFPTPPMDPSAPTDPSAPADPSAPTDPSAPPDRAPPDPSASPIAPGTPVVPPPPLPAGPTDRGTRGGRRGGGR